MKVLVTGAKGFIGKNLCESLKNIRDQKDRNSRYVPLLPLTIYEYDRDTGIDQLEEYCREADFVFNLAGINRPDDEKEFMEGNADFADELLTILEKQNNKCPVMLASSIQASLEGRFANSAYGKSKLAGENILREYSKRTGAPVLIYRFPNVYGKWCRPNYNSVIATFCYNIANNLPIEVHDRDTKLELVYIDDLVTSLISDSLRVHTPCRDDAFFHVGPIDVVSLGEIADALHQFKQCRDTLDIPQLRDGSFLKKLYSTYQSYLDPSDLSYELLTKKDERGSFTELLRTSDRGQISLNITAPGQTKGNHWHHTKWEKFIVVSGHAIVEQRQVGLDFEGNSYPVVRYNLSADNPTVIETPPGFTHNLINPSKDEDLVTIIWCNEIFDPDNPDTYYEKV